MKEFVLNDEDVQVLKRSLERRITVQLKKPKRKNCENQRIAGRLVAVNAVAMLI